MLYTLIIGNKNYSSWSLRPWFWMKYNNIEFQEKKILLFKEDTAANLEQYFSNFKVPVLIDNNANIKVWDTLAIMEYLAEEHINSYSYPKNKKSRALARSITAEMHSSFYHLRNELPMNCRKRFNNFTISYKAQQDVNRVVDIWDLCRSNHSDKGDWLFGEFSIADAMFAPIALRFYGYDIKLSPASKKYVTTIVNNIFIKDWIKKGAQEKEIIIEDEV